MSLVDDLLAKAGKTRADVASTSKVGQLFRRQGVRETPELRRILALPRRDLISGAQELAELLTAEYRRPGGKQTLRPIQAIALAELHDYRGLLAPIRVGGGKTLLSFLAAKVLEAKRPLLLIPAKLRHKTEKEWYALQEHWVLPQIRIESYETLGRAQSAEYLTNYKPDLISCDEVHKLKNTKAACTRRVRRYLTETRAALVASNNGAHLAWSDPRRPVFAGVSGTITRKSLHDVWHLLRWALGDEQMPLPAEWGELTEWADCLDAQGSGTRTAPGALIRLCDPADVAAAEAGGPEGLATVRRAYQRRFNETPGIVSTVDTQVSCSLTITQVDVQLDHLGPYFEQLRDTWETPDGHPFTEAVDLWRHARELVCGLYYVWDPRPPEKWLQARQAWCRFVRGVLKHSQRYDSELQVVRGVLAGEVSAKERDLFGAEVDVHAAWVAIRDSFKPNVKAVWIDDTVLKRAAQWMTDPGIVWCEHVAFGEKLAKTTGQPYFGAGGIDARTGRNIEEHPASEACIASIAANGEGRNLQRFSRNFVVSCPPSGAMQEQMLGRTHRDGQEADEVTFEVILACKEQWAGFQKALLDARYIEDTTGVNQKLNFADKDVMSPDDVNLLRGALWR